MRLRSRFIAITAALGSTAALLVGGTVFANSASAGVYSDKCGPGYKLARVEKIYSRGTHLGSIRIYSNDGRFCFMTTRAPKYRGSVGNVYTLIDGHRIKEQKVRRVGAVQKAGAGCHEYRAGVFRIHYDYYGSEAGRICS